MFFRSGLAIGAVIIATNWSGASAASRDCRAIVDPATRLACYDQAAGQTDPKPARRVREAAPVPVATAAPMAVREQPQPSEVAAAKPAPTAFDSRIASVVPLRHGYYRMQLEDGSAYDTTATGIPPQPGETVHIRRTFLGTIYLDSDGRSPIAVRLARRP